MWPRSDSGGMRSQPLRAGMLMECPACGKFHALEYERSESHGVLGQVDHYRCSKCDRRFEIAELQFKTV